MASEAHNLVGGEIVGGEAYPIFNPADFGVEVGVGRRADPALVDQAVDAADQAGKLWARTPLDTRKRALQAGHDALLAAAEREGWDRLLTLEQGKVISESRMEIGLALRRIGFVASIAEEALAEQMLEDARGRRIALFEPLGVVAIITPWNWPVLLTVSKVIPALLAGNAVVVKPAPNTPLVITRLLTVLAHALPPGVLSVVHGEADVGAALVAHPKVRKVNFTGSMASGRKVYAGAAGNVKNLTLELGGNDAAIVLEDAEFKPEMIGRMLMAIFATSGQVCMAIKRIYVHETRHDELRDALLAAAGRYVVGDGLNPDVNFGPLNNRAQYERVLGLIGAAEADGARLAAAGSRASGLDWKAGYFIQPTIATEVDDAMELVREEQFGPVIPLLRFRTEDEAVARANDSEYGLTGSVWGSDLERAFEVGKGLSAGAVSVNVHGVGTLDQMLAFGGVRQSGLGRQGAVEGLRAFTNQRYVHNRGPA